jgi:hypothetical protein
MVTRSFDNQPPYIALDEIVANTKSMLIAAQEKSMLIVNDPYAGPLFEKVPAMTEANWLGLPPPGLLGDIANFIYDAAVRPVKEVAIAGAIGLMAGICGRSYNISNTGLNQYVLVLAGTGHGKEAASQGIDKLISKCKVQVAAISDFIGPTEIASGQALIKYITHNPSFVSIVGEYGLALQMMNAFHASPAQVTLRKKLLELYNKSGCTDVLQSSIYADKDKNTQIVHAPAFSLLGESVPETYFAGLDDSMIQQGLLPRFLCIEYHGLRPAMNEKHAFVQPSGQVIEGLCQLAANSLTLMHNASHIDVAMSEQAQIFAREYNQEVDDRINAAESMLIAKELWNRAHLKMLKLAALVAVGINMYQPVIDLAEMKWAHKLVQRDILSMIEKFEHGKVGRDTGEHNQVGEMVKVVGDLLRRPFDDTMTKYGMTGQFKVDGIIPLAYLQRRLMSKNNFKNDRMGATYAINRTLQSLISDGSVMEIRQSDMLKRYSKTMKAYAVLDRARFV